MIIFSLEPTNLFKDLYDHEGKLTICQLIMDLRVSVINLDLLSRYDQNRSEPKDHLHE